MRLFDGNILMYASKPEYAILRKFLSAQGLSLSAISKVEVFGFSKLNENERELLEQFFSVARVYPVSNAVIDGAVKLRLQKKIRTVDAIIGSTALLLHAELVTRNTEDFKWIKGLKLVNPFDENE